MRQSLVGIQRPGPEPKEPEPPDPGPPGPPRTEEDPVVKLKVLGAISAPSPATTRSTDTVYLVLGASWESGLTKARRPLSAATTPAAICPLGPASVIVSLSIVSTCIG